MHRLLLRTAARREFYDAIAWYDDRDPGRGERFADAVAATLRQVVIQPDFFACVDGDVREAPVSRYPYRVFFVHDSETVFVIAILHAARNPSRLRRRIADEDQS